MHRERESQGEERDLTHSPSIRASSGIGWWKEVWSAGAIEVRIECVCERERNVIMHDNSDLAK